MLVLSRKIRESVAVGGANGFQPMLKVTVLEIQGGKVRLGFQGNASIPVHRWEVWERILTEERTDGTTDGPAATVPFPGS